MIKAEFLDLGLYNGMHEPDPAGSYRAFIVYDEGQLGDKPQSLTFLVPAHQLPTDHAQALVAEAYEVAAVIASDNVPATVKAAAIRDLTPSDALAAREARDKQVRAEALKEAAVNLRTYAPHLEDGPEYDVGYYHGHQTALDRILALIPADQEGDQ